MSMGFVSLTNGQCACRMHNILQTQKTYIGTPPFGPKVKAIYIYMYVYMAPFRTLVTSNFSEPN